MSGERQPAGEGEGRARGQGATGLPGGVSVSLSALERCAKSGSPCAQARCGWGGTMLRASPRVPAPAAGLGRLVSAVRARLQRTWQKISKFTRMIIYPVRVPGNTRVICWDSLADEDLEAARQRFLGTIEQQTPAWHTRGDGAEGKPGETRAVVVRVRRLELTRGGSGGRDVAFSLVCSKGTNVDVLMRDLVRCAHACIVF